MTAPLHSFTSHIAGKNAKVEIYPDRIEWERPRGVSAGKITAGILTAGMSMAVTGVKNGKSGTEMIPVRSISSVTTKRDGLLNTFVSVITSGNTVDFRVSHAEAKIVKDTLTRLLLEPAAPSTPPQTAGGGVTPPAGDVTEQLRKLGELRDAGVLTDDEFAAKKTEMLGRL